MGVISGSRSGLERRDSVPACALRLRSWWSTGRRQSRRRHFAGTGAGATALLQSLRVPTHPNPARSAVESRDCGWVGRGPTESGRPTSGPPTWSAASPRLLISWGGTVPLRGTSDPTLLSSVCSRRRPCKSEESTAGVPTLSVGPLIHTSDPTLHNTLVLTRARARSPHPPKLPSTHRA